MLKLVHTRLTQVRMAFSDEPTVVVASGRRRWLWWAVPAILLFVAGVGFAALDGPIHEWFKDRAEHGPNHGTVYRFKDADRAWSLEFARNADGNPLFFPNPVPANPAEYSLRYRLANAKSEEDRAFVPTEWDASNSSWVNKQQRLHPMADVRIEAELSQAGRVLWRSEEWAYGEEGHHH